MQRAARVLRGRPGGPATVGTEPGFQVAFLGGLDQGVGHLAGVHAAPALDVQAGEGWEPGFYGLARLVWSSASGAGYLASTRERPLLGSVTLGWKLPKKCSRETRS